MQVALGRHRARSWRHRGLREHQMPGTAPSGAAFSFHQVEADTMGRGGKRPHHGRGTAGLTSSPVLASSNHRASDPADAGVCTARARI